MAKKYLNIGPAMQEIGRLSASIGAAIAAGDTEKMSPEKDYAYNTFVAEWNGKAVDRTKPSVQRQIGALVAGAGKMLNPRREQPEE